MTVTVTVAVNLIERLRGFNRKERYYVGGTALGNPKFRLSPAFRAALDEKFGVLVPPDAFAAMDYHLDWLYAAVFLAANGRTDGVFKMPKQITANQEDIDLLVAYPDGDTCHSSCLRRRVLADSLTSRWTASGCGFSPSRQGRD